jgi:hypothetical protein
VLLIAFPMCVQQSHAPLSVQCLSEEDREIDAIVGALAMLKKGVAIHHSGLLPIVKEIVELLFQEGLVKVLFATETVSGLTCSARVRKCCFALTCERGLSNSRALYSVRAPKAGKVDG